MVLCFLSGKCAANAEKQDRRRVGTLVDIAYMMAKEDMSLKKFLSITTVEKNHGVDLGVTYQNEKYCKVFTDCVGIALERELKKDLQEATYFSILVDGSTDSSVTEQELFFVIYVNKEGQLKHNFLKIMNVKHATASGLQELLMEVMQLYDIDTKKQYLIGLGADGAALRTLFIKNHDPAHGY